MAEINKEKEAGFTQEQLKEVLNYNHETGVFTWKVGKSGTKGIGSVAGGVKKDGYINIKINSKCYRAHRLAWLHVYKEFPSGMVDHIDGSKVNNQIKNLRVVTNAENQKNKRIGSNNTSGVGGVHRRGKANNSKTNYMVNWYWVASWYNEKGERKQKNFNIINYGEEQAKTLAVAYRAMQISLLKVKHNINYSERHGK